MKWLVLGRCAFRAFNILGQVDVKDGVCLISLVGELCMCLNCIVTSPVVIKIWPLLTKINVRHLDIYLVDIAGKMRPVNFLLLIVPGLNCNNGINPAGRYLRACRLLCAKCINSLSVHPITFY